MQGPLARLRRIEHIQELSARIDALARIGRTAQARESQALELLAEILGGGPTSYLYRRLVMERGVAVNAGACER